MAQPSTRPPAGRTTTTVQVAGALYRPMGHLVVRAPLLPADAYLALGARAGPGPGGPGALAPEVRHALAVASPSLLAALERAGRVHLSERAPGGSGAGGDSVSVRATGAVRQALGAARRPIPYADLAAGLLAAIPGATLEQVAQLIAQLCEATLLLTDLRPPLTTPDPAGW